MCVIVPVLLHLVYSCWVLIKVALATILPNLQGLPSSYQGELLGKTPRKHVRICAPVTYTAKLLLRIVFGAQSSETQKLILITDCRQLDCLMR